MISVRCGCGKRIEVPKKLIGKMLSCRSCKGSLRLVASDPSAAASPPGNALLVLDGPHRVGEQLFLVGDEPLQLGKLPGSEVLLKGNRVSRSHCRLVPEQGGWRIEDETSTNGTFVNGQRVANRLLRHGDRLAVGDFKFRFVSTSGEALPAKHKKKPRPEAPATQPAKEEEIFAVAIPVEDDELDPAGSFGIADDEWDSLASAGEIVETGSSTAIADDEASGSHMTATGGGFVERHTGPGPECPCCEQMLAANAKLCVQCGISVKTGRSILTSHGSDLDQVYINAENIIRVISWVFWFGIYPFASEAFGTKKPHVIRAVAVLTILTSVWFLAYEWSASPRMQEMKNLMLWVGEEMPDADEIAAFYFMTSYGDSDAFFANLEELDWDNPELDENQAILAAHTSLSREQQYHGQYGSSQLITHAFLHGDLLHLAGNLLFLLVFGSRVNAIIGNLFTLLAYPILAVGAAVVFMISASTSSPTPMLGASGAIMGLAGMYFVLAPVHQVHVAAWTRWGIIAWFHLSLRLWSLRGFWVVLFYIAFDVAFTAMGIEEGTAHWAHLGGFLVGMLLALILLFSRLVNCRGADLVTAILGKPAWALVGKPNR